MGALTLYLDFINLFLFMLRFSATGAEQANLPAKQSSTVTEAPRLDVRGVLLLCGRA